MGGCRCAYRNCTVKSDKKTHMFHFPVFERVRCHQWLVNAQKLNFLNLKVSQLKNRVICQHHFKDDNFMNYRKDKLTFEAIPTENGPFCDPKKFEEQKPVTSYSNLILLEDIENDVIDDKKANYSLKYGDFLTNSELMDAPKSNDINLTKDNTIINIESAIDLNYENQVTLFNKRFEPSKVNKFQPKPVLLQPQPMLFQAQPVLLVPPFLACPNPIQHEPNVENQIAQQLGVNVVLNENYDNTINNQNNIQQMNVDNIINKQIINQSKTVDKTINKPIKIQLKPVDNSVGKHINIDLKTEDNTDTNVVIKKEPKIKILSEKKIELPLPIRGQLKKVTPSTTLNLCKNRVQNEEPIIISETSPVSEMVIHANKPSDRLKVLEVLNVEFGDQSKENKQQNVQVITRKEEVENIAATRTSPRTQKIKNTITPERSAAIEQKRKFNMKMKHVLETCLDNLDEPTKPERKVSLLKSPIKSQVKEHVSKKYSVIKSDKFNVEQEVIDQSMSKFQECTLAFLDTRMKAMENTLLNKIEQNSHNIMKLQDSLKFESVEKKKPEQRKIISKQISMDESSHKKYLFDEISKYLSPSSSSIIYDELFNKEIMSPRKKRRKFI